MARAGADLRQADAITVSAAVATKMNISRQRCAQIADDANAAAKHQSDAGGGMVEPRASEDSGSRSAILPNIEASRERRPSRSAADSTRQRCSLCRSGDSPAPDNEQQTPAQSAQRARRAGG